MVFMLEIKMKRTRSNNKGNAKSKSLKIKKIQKPKTPKIPPKIQRRYFSAVLYSSSQGNIIRSVATVYNKNLYILHSTEDNGVLPRLSITKTALRTPAQHLGIVRKYRKTISPIYRSALIHKSKISAEFNWIYNYVTRNMYTPDDIQSYNIISELPPSFWII